MSNYINFKNKLNFLPVILTKKQNTAPLKKCADGQIKHHKGSDIWQQIIKTTASKNINNYRKTHYNDPKPINTTLIVPGFNILSL